MLQRKYILILAITMLVIAGAWTVLANNLADQKVVLSGKVLAGGMASPGASVREGDILLVVDTITGPVPAARATSDGIVREVLVKPGDSVRSGDVVVRLEPNRK